MKKDPRKFVTKEFKSTIALSGKVVISDPCYHTDIWCNQHIKVKPGEWKWSIRMVEIPGGDYYPSVAGLSARHPDYPDIKTDEMIGPAMVDSGQLGIFDEEYYRDNSYLEDEKTNEKHEVWYKRVCDITLKISAGTIDGKGVVSESGYGDGSYGVFVGRNEDGEIVAIEIPFV